MNFEIKQSILLENLNYVIKGISNKNIIPILNCIKFELKNDGLYMTSTDNEITVRTFIPNDDIEKINELGEIVVSGRYIYEIIRKLPDTLIKIEEVIDNKLNITTSNSEFNLNCNDISEFPEIDLSDSKKPIRINKKLFKTMVKQTSFACSTQENRPEFTGINVRIEKNNFECIATDSYRLAKKVIELDNPVEENINIIIPNKNIIELERMIIDNDEDLEIHIFNNKIIFKFDNIIILNRLINGNYPDTNKLIPNEFNISVSVDLKDIYNAIDRASLLTSEYDKNTVKLELENNLIKISSNIPEIGYVEEHLETIDKYDGVFKLSFSAKYMLDALKVFECDTVTINFNGEEKPIIVKNIVEDGVTELILPVKTY